MRIIQVIRSMTFGGAENHVLSLSLGLRSRGHKVLVAAPANSWIDAQCRANQLPVETLPMRGVFDFFSYWKLHRLIRTWQADIAHAHQVRPSQYVGIAAMGTRAVPVSTVHSTTSSKHMRRCRHLIAVADAVKKNLVRHRYPEERITRIYNGVPDVVRGERLALRRELHIPEGQFAVVLAGRFHRDKGQDVLIEAGKACPDDVHFYFIGDTATPFGKEVTSLAGGDARFHFLGYRPDVQRILPAFDLYAAPSRREAFSLALVEAGAAQLPIVGMDVGGIPESVVDGETGLLVEAGNTAAFALAIQRLASSPALREAMGYRARERYEQLFTVEQMLAQTEQVYQKLLEAA
ncbi:MAG: glycosyltransferase [Alistipes senegalensis]|nr:glycosyltransferase [Oxalobacter formigenes]MCM1281566.1 glycosyltransferase [Alistipes senegalensis]